MRISFRACTPMIASILAFRIIQTHANWFTDAKDMAIAVSGSNQAAGTLGHTNYVVNPAIRIRFRSPDSPLSNAPIFRKIR